MSHTPGIDCAIDGPLLRICLARPEKRNALNPPMFAALDAALKAGEVDPNIRVILLQAEGTDFCAGWDASGMEAAKDGDADLAAAGRFIRTLARMTKPLVASVQGRAIGIGFTLLLHVDHIVLAEDARLISPFTKLGMTPEAGSTLLLRQRIGSARAFDALVASRPISAQDAYAWGLVNALAPADAIQEVALAAARELAALPQRAVSEAKALLRQTSSILERIEQEGAVFDAVIASVA